VKKDILRKTVLEARLALTLAETKEKSSLITQRILALDEIKQAQVIMVYADFRQEVRTDLLIEKIMATNKQVAVPLTMPQKGVMYPSLIENYPGDLAPGRWGIPEPKPHLFRQVEHREIDCVLVPGVAFDLNGHRLGYGGGYYDRFLPLLKPGAVLIAPAYELQMRQDLEPESHDLPVHYIVTEKRLIKVR
jgi:5-formyltetrahydrofolate cyclo-ligase